MKDEERGSEPLLFQKVLCVFLANEQPGETAEKYGLKTFLLSSSDVPISNAQILHQNAITLDEYLQRNRN